MLKPLAHIDQDTDLITTAFPRTDAGFFYSVRAKQPRSGTLHPLNVSERNEPNQHNRPIEKSRYRQSYTGRRLGTLPLEAVVEHYDRGGVKNPNLDRRIKPLKLSKREKTDLVSFLKALSGEGWQQIKAPKSFPE